MPNIETWGVGVMTVTLDGSGDWTCSRDIIPTGIYLFEAAANEYVEIYQNTDTGPSFTLRTVDGGPVGMRIGFSQPWKPGVDQSDSSYVGTVKVVVTFE